MGFTQFFDNWNNPQMKNILKSSLIILDTAESVCIITAETVPLPFYQYSIFLAIPLALVIGTFTLTRVESARKIKDLRKVQECRCENSEYKDCLPDSLSHFIILSEFRRQNKDN